MADLQVPACPECGGGAWILTGRSEPLLVNGQLRVWLTFQCETCGAVHDMPINVPPLEAE